MKPAKGPMKSLGDPPLPLVTTLTYRAQIGRRLALARTRRGVSQDNLATMLGVARRTVSDWERGVSSIPSEALGRACHELGCSGEWIIGRPDGDTVYLIHSLVEAQLLAAPTFDIDFVDRLPRLATIADETTDRVTLQAFAQRIARMQEHTERIRNNTEMRSRRDGKDAADL